MEQNGNNQNGNDYKRLKKGRNRMLCGVCSGVGEYFNIDPTVVRLIFALLIFTGTSIFAYIIMAVIMPDA